MSWLLPVLVLAAQAPAAAAQAAPPDTEVYLAPLSIVGRKVTIGTPRNISENPGYDNQPSFTPDGSGVLFTSVRGGGKPDPANAAASGSDIYRFDVRSGRTTRVTDTPESEYSPTVTPDGAHISVIRVEADGTQRLWRFTLQGQSPELVLADIKPVGYHAWIDADRLALFVLGQPATLQLADRVSGRADVKARNIGRSIQRMPDGGVSFVLREAPAAGPEGQKAPPRLSVHRLDPKTGETRPLVEIPAGAADADLAWTPDGTLLMAFQGQLLGWRNGDKAFEKVADLGSIGLTGVTRLAVSPNGDQIAIVSQASNARPKGSG